MVSLPIEIINKIFTYISSPIASIIKDSEFYGKSFPFFYLEQNNVNYPTNNIQWDYIQINKLIKNQRFGDDTYYLFHHYTNYINDSFISEQTTVVYLLNSILRYRLTIHNNIEDLYEELLIDNLDFLNNIFFI
jgi:hypothetical protein